MYHLLWASERRLIVHYQSMSSQVLHRMFSRLLRKPDRIKPVEKHKLSKTRLHKYINPPERLSVHSWRNTWTEVFQDRRDSFRNKPRLWRKACYMSDTWKYPLPQSSTRAHFYLRKVLNSILLELQQAARSVSNFMRGVWKHPSWKRRARPIERRAYQRERVSEMPCLPKCHRQDWRVQHDDLHEFKVPQFESRWHSFLLYMRTKH